MCSNIVTLLASIFLNLLQSAAVDAPFAEFQQRRTRLAEIIGDGSVWLQGNSFAPNERFLQNADFYYFTGVGAPDASLLMLCRAGKLREQILFLPGKDPQWEKWNGPRLAPGAEAQRRTGIQEIQPTEKREEIFSLYRIEEADLLQNTRKHFDTLQVRKSAEEIQRIERAIRITQMAMQTALPFLRPESNEFQLLGAIEGTFLGLGAQGNAFPGIVASGPNSCVLHYMNARRRMQKGELVVIDIGAKFEHYCADITRTFPVDGKFNKRQAEIYSIVLQAQDKAMQAIKPGVSLAHIHGIAFEYIKEKGYAENFWHFTSHYLGLRAHDTSSMVNEKLQAGMVITVEPGIYLPEENLGVRIEDDVLVTADGFRNLSADIPKEIAELEAWLEQVQ